jgi:hypothetical protein
VNLSDYSRTGRKGQTWPAINSLVVPRADLAGFAAALRAGLEVSECLEGSKGESGSFGSVEKDKFGLPQIVW